MPCSPLLNALLQKNLIRVFWLFITASLLTACGGGGDPSVPDNLDELGVEGTIVISLPTSTDGETLSQTQNNTVQVTITDNNNSGISGEIIGLTTNIGVIEGNGQAITDANGVAQFTITLNGATEGDAGVLTASFSSDATGLNGSVSLNVAAGPATTAVSANVNLTVQNASGTATTGLSQTSSSDNVLLITLTDGAQALTGELVSITSTIGEISPNGGLLLTGAGGQAQATVNVAGIDDNTAGTITVSYTNPDDNSTVTDTANVSVLPISGSNGTGISIEISVQDPVTNTVTSSLNPSLGNEINITLLNGEDAFSGEIVSLTSTLGNIVPNGGNLLTDSEGTTSATILTNGIDAGTAGVITVTYTEPDQTTPITQSLNVQVSEVDDTEAASINISVLDPNTNANTTSLNPSQGNEINIQLLEGTTGIEGEIISLTSTIGTIVPNGGNLLTGSAGEVTGRIVTSGIDSGTAGVVTVSYTAEDGATPITQSINVQVGTTSSGSSPFLNISVIDPNDDEETSVLSTTEGNRVDIILNDGQGGFIAGQIVTLSTTVGSISPTGGVLLTDEQGRASATIISEGVDPQTAGVVTISYTSPDTNETITESLNVEVGAAISGEDGAAGVVSVAAAMYEQLAYLLDPTITEETRRINPVQPATIEITLQIDDAPVENAVVQVSTDLGVLVPESGRVITNSDGIATIELETGDAVSGEAGTVTITAAGDSDTITFGIGSATLAMGSGSGATFSSGTLVVGDTTLSATGNTSISVNIVDTTEPDSGDSNSLFTTPVEVAFTSGCIESGDATIDTPVTTVGGVATASYSVAGCEDSDTITASIVDVAGPSASAEVSIIASIPNSISFESAEPEVIALKGTGGTGRLESADVTFAIIDNTGAPEAGVVVNFALTTDTGDIELVDDTALTNLNGQVVAKISSGTIPTPVRVIATVSLLADGTSVSDVNGDGFSDDDGTSAVTETISTVSDVLVISTGLPDQNSLSVATEVINRGGANTFGLETTITLQAADAFNNPVPDGTAINFRTEFGAIDPSCTTLNGSCSVTWRSQNPRAHLTFDADRLDTTVCDSTTGNTTNRPCIQNDAITEFSRFASPDGALSTILAYALGEETFVDANGNGLYDSGEEFEDMPEAFMDHNDDDEFGNSITTGSCFAAGCPETQGGNEETFVDFNVNGQYDAGDGIYNGSLCSETAEASGDCTTNLINVWSTTWVRLSATTPYFGLYDPSGNAVDNSYEVRITGTNTSESLTLYIADVFNGSLPSGTEVTVSTTNCEITTPTEFEFAANQISMMQISIGLTEDEDDNGTAGTVTVAVGDEFSFSFDCLDQT